MTSELIGAMQAGCPPQRSVILLSVAVYVPFDVYVCVFWPGRRQPSAGAKQCVTGSLAPSPKSIVWEMFCGIWPPIHVLNVTVSGASPRVGDALMCRASPSPPLPPPPTHQRRIVSLVRGPYTPHPSARSELETTPCFSCHDPSAASVALPK